MQPEPLVELPDGTVKQVSPLTGTVVWTVPRRAHRPLERPRPDPRPVAPANRDRLCAFCSERYLETPPEKERLVEGVDGTWSVRRHLPAEQLEESVAAFRRIPNLFEIVSVDYWRANHGFEPSVEVRERAGRYGSTPLGRTHLLAILRRRSADEGSAEGEGRSDADLLAGAADLFAGSHDVVVARRHLADGATHADELAGSGTLTPVTHDRFIAFTVEALRSLYAEQPAARYVVVFQNWLAAAGASFDHLHKQLVAIDEHGPRVDGLLTRLRADPAVFRRVLEHAERNRLVVAQNEHAVAVAAVGRRYPSLEVYSRAPDLRPWEHTDRQIRGVSDLVHALHAATGPRIPTNEEWYYRPVDCDEPLPWHVVLKWRTSTLAGFEGGTRINVNTISPALLQERVVGALRALRGEGAIADVAIGAG